MESFFVLLAVLVPLTVVVLLGYGLYVAYRYFTNKNSFSPAGSHSSQLPELTYPAHYGVFIGALLLGFNIGLYDTFAIRVPALGLAVFLTCMAVAWLAIFWQKRSWLIYTLVAVIALSGWGMLWRANGFVQSINVTMAILAQVLLYVFLIRSYVMTSLLNYFQTLLLAIPAGIRQFFVVLKDTFSAGKQQKKYSVLSWVKTLSITLLVAIFFISLLSAGDPVFGEIIKDIRDQLVGRVLWSIFLLFISSVFLTLVLPEKDNTEWKLGFLSNRDSGFVVGSLVAIFSIFLFVQVRYLFGGSTDLLTELDLTFSEYVRKGFMELLIATFFGGIIAYLVAIKVRAQSGLQSALWLKIGNSVLLAQLGMLLVSAFKRDLLYVDTYGLTRVRIVGGLFLLWLAVFLILLLVFTIRKNIKESKILVGLLLSSIVVWGTLNVVNIDRWVAAGAPGHHEYVDYFYISNLSEDAAQDWVTAVPEIETRVAALTAKSELTDIEKSELAGLKLSLHTIRHKVVKLYLQYATEAYLLSHQQSFPPLDNLYYYSSFTAAPDADATELSDWLQDQRQWQAFNYSQWQAFQLLQSHEQLFFETIPQLLTDIQVFQIQTKTNLRKEQDRLLYEFSYPFLNIERGFSTSAVNPVSVSQPSAAVTAMLADNQYSVAQLSEQCTTLSGTEIEMYGFVRRQATRSGEILVLFDTEDPRQRVVLQISDQMLREELNSVRDELFVRLVLVPGTQVTQQDATQSAVVSTCGSTVIAIEELMDVE